jgi:GNAT superfamily N-acetyltransferase
MQLTMRRYGDEGDYWRIREFLRQVFMINERRELSWQAYRFDYWRWHIVENIGLGSLEKDVFLWEAQDGGIAAVLNPEGKGIAYLQVHPQSRSSELESEMLAVAEEHLAISKSKDHRWLGVFAHEHDELRLEILNRRGYRESSIKENHHRRSMSIPIPDVVITEGYALRALGDKEELPARSFVSWQAFHPDEPEDNYEGWEWYRNVQRAPLYRRDLDIVAVAHNGEFASFCTVWFDDVTRCGAFEPVGTAPSHQRRGLARVVMYEGLRRLKRLGAAMAYVGSGSPAAHDFYVSIGFNEIEHSVMWEKEL